MKTQRFLWVIIISIILFVASEIALIYYGLAKVYFFFIIPVFVSSSPLSIIPFLLLLMPFILSFMFMYGDNVEGLGEEQPQFDKTIFTEEKPKKEINYGGFIMIGPIPILFGNRMNKSLLYLLIAIMILIMVLFIIFTR